MKTSGGWLTTVASCLVLAACSGGGSSTQSGTPSGSSSGSTSPAGVCEGKRLGCQYVRLNDCGYQPNCTTIHLDCRFDSSISPEPECADLAGDECGETIGCTWKPEGGAPVALEFGSCTGTALPCTAMKSKDDCRSIYGAFEGTSVCQWLPSPNGDPALDRCEGGGGSACSDFSAPKPVSAENHTAHPKRMKPACEGRQGCTWEPTP